MSIDYEQCTVCGDVLRTMATKKAFIVYKCPRCNTAINLLNEIEKRFPILVKCIQEEIK